MNDAAIIQSVLAILEHGDTQSTYKFATLLALVDACITKADQIRQGESTVLRTHELAEQVLLYFWNHVTPWQFDQKAFIPRQTWQGELGSILTPVKKFRERNGYCSLAQARRIQPDKYEALLRKIETTLIQMPIPNLQRIHKTYVPALFDIAWDDSISSSTGKARLNEYFETGKGFDNRIRLHPGVADVLIRYANVLRPTIQHYWTLEVARINQLPGSDLQRWLFQPERQDLTDLRAPVLRQQNGLCFFCEGKTRVNSAVVDHFIPFSRFPDDGLCNLVVSHRECNARKSDHLACIAHVQRWVTRNWVPDGSPTAEMSDLATVTGWPLESARTRNAARSIFLNLPLGYPLWRTGAQFDFLTAADLDALRHILGSPPPH